MQDWLVQNMYIFYMSVCIFIKKKKSFNVCIFIKKELFLHVVFTHYYNPRKEFAMGKMILTCQQVLFFFFISATPSKTWKVFNSVEMCILLGNFGSIIFLKISAPLNLKFWPYIKRTVTVFNCNSSSTTARNLLTLWRYLGHNVYT